MMKKNFKMCPATKFIVWCILGLLICIIGISNVFALTNDNRIEFYDNNGSSASAITTYFDQPTNFSWATFSTTANSYGGLVLITLNQPLLKDYIYTIFLSVGAANMGGATRLSTKNCIGLSDGKNGAINNYVSCDITPSYSDYTNSTGDYTRGLYFTFIAKRNGIYLALPYTSQYTCTNCQQYSYGYELNTIGNSADLTQTQLNNVINNQTTYIQNEIANMGSDISDSIQDMGDSINDTITDNMQTCYEQQNITFTTKNGYELDTNGNEVANSSWLVTDYIKVIPGLTYNFSGFSSQYNVYYDINKNYVGKIFSNTITIPEGVYYIRKNSTISGYNGAITQQQGCLNKLDQQTNAINGINDILNDDSSATFDSSMINLIPNAPITNLLTIPISLLQSILTRANNTCSSITIPFLFNHNITFPCFTLSDYFGSVANTIDLCICFVMIYNIFMLFVSVFEDITTLRDGFLGLYEPQHAVGSYKPRHGKG